MRGRRGRHARGLLRVWSGDVDVELFRGGEGLDERHETGGGDAVVVHHEDVHAAVARGHHGRADDGASVRNERRRIISVPGRNLARGGGRVSLPSACVRERARGDAGRSKRSSARSRGCVGASRGDVGARCTVPPPRPFRLSFFVSPEAERTPIRTPTRIRSRISRQKMIRERPSVRSRRQISPGHTHGRNLPRRGTARISLSCGAPRARAPEENLHA